MDVVSNTIIKTIKTASLRLIQWTGFTIRPWSLMGFLLMRIGWFHHFTQSWCGPIPCNLSCIIRRHKRCCRKQGKVPSCVHEKNRFIWCVFGFQCTYNVFADCGVVTYAGYQLLQSQEVSHTSRKQHFRCLIRCRSTFFSARHTLVTSRHADSFFVDEEIAVVTKHSLGRTTAVTGAVGRDGAVW